MSKSIESDGCAAIRSAPGRQPGAVGATILLLVLLLWARAGLAGDISKRGGADDAIQVMITTHLGDGHRFVKGDSIAFFLSLDQDAHIVAIYEDADHDKIQIIPNANQEDDFFPSGLFRPIPGKDAAFRFTIAPPFGQERLWVFASREPIAALPGEPLANGLKRLDLDIATIKDRIRVQAGSAYGEYCLPLHTLARPSY
jgi:hypothetical protein